VDWDHPLHLRRRRAPTTSRSRRRNSHLSLSLRLHIQRSSLRSAYKGKSQKKMFVWIGLDWVFSLFAWFPLQLDPKEDNDRAAAVADEKYRRRQVSLVANDGENDNENFIENVFHLSCLLSCFFFFILVILSSSLTEAVEAVVGQPSRRTSRDPPNTTSLFRFLSLFNSHLKKKPFYGYQHLVLDTK